VLQQLTGETELTGSAMLEYFNPLFDFLDPAGEVPSQSHPAQPLVSNIGNKANAPAADEPVDQTIPIVVGAILGAVVVVALVAYFVNQYRNRSKE
jgi:hypothetical protein